MRSFLARLADAEKALAAADEEVTDPLDAARGSVIDSRYRLERRLGAGSTAVGLLVTDLAAGTDWPQPVSCSRCESRLLLPVSASMPRQVRKEYCERRICTSMFTNDSDAMRTIAGLPANEAKQALTAAVTGFGQEAVDELVNEPIQPGRDFEAKTSVYHVIDALTSDEAKTALGLLSIDMGTRVLSQCLWGEAAGRLARLVVLPTWPGRA